MRTPSPRTSWLRRLAAGAVAFVAAPASSLPLAVLRLGVAGVLLVQAFLIAPDVSLLYGPRGVIQWQVSEQWITIGAPRLWWFARALAPFDLDAETVVKGMFVLYAVSLGCLFVGWRTRLAAVVAWLTHLTFKMTGSAGIYGVDHFANISLFYLVWMPAAECLSLDRRAGRTTGAPSPAARLSLRVLQLHLCIVYFASGIEKATGTDWRNGDVMWYALMRPDLSQFDFSWLAQVEWLAVLLAWGTLILEIGYPIYIWVPWTRRAWAWAVIGMHAGIAVAMGLWTFSGIMIVLNVAALLVPAEPAPAPVENKPPASGPAPAAEGTEAATQPRPEEAARTAP
jgi:hypothetical protein